MFTDKKKIKMDLSIRKKTFYIYIYIYTFFFSKHNKNLSIYKYRLETASNEVQREISNCNANIITWCCLFFFCFCCFFLTAVWLPYGKLWTFVDMTSYLLYINQCVVYTQHQGHQETFNKVGCISLVRCPVWLALASFWS